MSYNHKEYMRKWHIENSEKHKRGMKSWRQKNRFYVCLMKSMEFARKKHHVPCDATISELEDSFTGHCFLCGSAESHKKLHMDHDHETGEFRGWLCNKCNQAIGLMQDSPEIAFRVAIYLESSSILEGKRV